MMVVAMNSATLEAQAVAGAADAASVRAWAIGLIFIVIVAAGALVDFGLAFGLWRRPMRWLPRERLFLRRPWARRDAAGLLVWLFGCYALAILLKPVWDRLSGSETVWVILVSALVNVAGLWLVKRSLARRGLTWRAAFGWSRQAWPARLGSGAAYYLAAMPLVWFYSLVYQGGLRAAGYKAEWQDVAITFVSETSTLARVLLFLLAVGLAPVFEEVLFRGILLPLAARRWGTAVGVAAVSALFAAVHFHLPSLVPLFVIAVAFSLGYVYSGSLVVPVVMHALFNGVNLVLLGLLR